MLAISAGYWEEREGVVGAQTSSWQQEHSSSPAASQQEISEREYCWLGPLFILDLVMIQRLSLTTRDKRPPRPSPAEIYQFEGSKNGWANWAGPHARQSLCQTSNWDVAVQVDHSIYVWGRHEESHWRGRWPLYVYITVLCALFSPCQPSWGAKYRRSERRQLLECI